MLLWTVPRHRDHDAYAVGTEFLAQRARVEEFRAALELADAEPKTRGTSDEMEDMLMIKPRVRGREAG